MSVAYRPSHADATYDMKYGIRAVEVRPFVLYQNMFGNTFGNIIHILCVFLVGWWQIFRQGNYWEGCCWSRC